MKNNTPNIVWHLQTIKKSDRIKKYSHKATVIWLTGLPAAGKSTIAHELESHLFSIGCHTYVMDGDNVRHGLNKDLGFSPDERSENIRRIAEVAKLFTDAGIIVLTAFISPYGEDRKKARNLIGKEEFIEVFVKCPLNVCEKRDPKGMYKKARAGEIQEFTGVSAPYEEPNDSEIVVDTSRSSPVECSNSIIKYLYKKRIIRKYR